MKYVRTKDGRIIEIPNKHKETVYDGNVVISLEKIINGVKGVEIVNGIVDRKADTIEELCDWFIVEGDDNEIIYRKTLFSAETDGKDYILESNETFTIYGCVLDKGKGLIYVAKMNDKGALELL